MPERSFGRTVRYRRTKLGMSQAQLGQLVGRSAATIRSWESDKSLPNDPEVLTVLSVVIGIESEILFDKAGVEKPPVVETSPTIEQALASLAPDIPERDPDTDPESESEVVETSPTVEHVLAALAPEEVEPDEVGHVEGAEEPVFDLADHTSPEEGVSGDLPATLFATLDEEDEADLEELAEQVDNEEEAEVVGRHAATPIAEEVDPGPEESPAGESGEEEDEDEAGEEGDSEQSHVISLPVPRSETRPDEAERPSFSLPRSQVQTVPADPSYLENPSERRFYQVRTVATVAGLVVLLIVFLWAVGQGLGALVDWWGDFFDNLRL